jgi:D-glycero-D-manno-heptose 1,7-bisphosphate phosphatase
VTPGPTARGGAPAVFLDRDGVLDRAVVRAGKPHPPGTLAELEILPGVAEACAALRRAGFLLIAVTNQPDVRRGTQRRETVDAINDEVRRCLALDDVRTCFHDDADRCGCRKPEPGLLVDAARDWGIALASSVMVGDRWRDVESGRRAGCWTVFIDHGYDERRPDAPDLVTASLPEAVPWIVARLAVERNMAR